MEQATQSLILLNDAMFISMVLLLKNAYSEWYVNKRNVFFAIILLTTFCLYPFCTGDYWHYAETFNTVKNTSYNVNLEPIYLNLINSVSNYHFFRVYVWGPAIFLLIFCFRLSKIDIGIALFFFITRYITTFSYARVSLSMAILFFGLMVIGNAIDNRTRLSKLIYILCGLVIMYYSIYFHKSAIFGLAISLFSLVLLKQNKFTVSVTILGIPFFVIAIYTMIGYFVSFDMEDDVLMLGKANIYLEREGSGYDSFTKSIISNILRLPNYIAAFLCIKAIIQKYYKEWPTTIKLCTNATFFCILISTIFFFISYNMFSRFSNFVMIPSVVFISYCHINGYFEKEIKWYVWLSLIGLSMNFVYKTITA